MITEIESVGENLTNKVSFDPPIGNSIKKVLLVETQGTLNYIPFTNGELLAKYSDNKVKIFLNIQGELVLYGESITEEELAKYSINEDGELIYTY